MNSNALTSSYASQSIAADAICAVTFAGVCKRLGTREILRDISFSTMPGESVAVIGLNGAGKTTLLRALLGFIQIDQGKIELFGIDAQTPIARENVAFLPERLILGPDLSGWRSLQMLLGIRSIKPQRDRCEQDLLALGFPIEQLDAPAKTYSKGMAQKIGLAAAMNSQAKLAVLDEPMSGLDPKARRAMNASLIHWRQAGRGLIFTAHSFAGLDLLCDQIAIINQGGLAFFGSPALLLQQFATSNPDGAAAGEALESAFLNCVESTEELL